MAVLIVYGDTSVMGELAHSLEEDGHDVVTAGSGRRALDMLKCNQSIKAVVVDRLLPDMSPFDLFQAYNAYRELKWPGCETSRCSPSFILSHPQLSHEASRRDVLNAMSGIANDSVISERTTAPTTQSSVPTS